MGQKYVNGLNVRELYALDPPGNWRNISGNASNLPSYVNDETGEKLRVAVGSSSKGSYVVFQHNVGAPNGLFDPLHVAGTDGAAAAFLREYMSAHNTTPGHK